MQETEKCSVISIIGPTNAGKSSLVNALVGEKISIVTHKVQTTRSTIKGIINCGTSQLIFVDTPGIFKPKRGLEKLMTKTAWRTFSDGEVAMLVIDSSKGITNNVKSIITNITNPAIAVLNKVDLVNKPELLQLTTQINSLFNFDMTFMVSALTNSGVEDIKKYLATTAPVFPWIYTQDEVTDASLKFILSEITREQLFLRIHQELPYQSIVETEMVKEINEEQVEVYQVIYVISENHKKIITGKNRSTLNYIIKHSTQAMEKEMQKKVSLNLFIKVRKEWISNEQILSNIGY